MGVYHIKLSWLQKQACTVRNLSNVPLHLSGHFVIIRIHLDALFTN